MGKRHIRLGGLVVLAAGWLVVEACHNSGSNKKSREEGEVPALAGSMQGFKANLTRLLPLVIDSKKFSSIENKKQITQEVDNLLAISKRVVHIPQVNSMDLSLRFIADAFTDELKRAKESIDSDRMEFARYTLMKMTSYCIECHTRTSSGPSFDTGELEQGLKSMTSMERGEYLLATRQFDRAFDEFQEVIKFSLSKKTNLFDMDRAARYALAISVRYERNPKKSLKIAQLIANHDQSPVYLKQSARIWETSIKDWMKEKKQSLDDVEDVLKHSRSLVDMGYKAQMSLYDRSGEVVFLRVLSDLHLLLAKTLNKNQLGEVLYLTGLSYEVVRDLSVWSIHEDYYETCIRQAPHTTWSEKCFSKLEQSIYFGYTGSRGLSLPMDVQNKLDELKKLAFEEAIKE